MNVAAFILAADPTSTVLDQWGAPGAIIVVLGLFAWNTIKRERDRGDRLERQLQDVNDKLVERFADLARDTRDALKDVNDYLRDVVRRRQR